MSDEWEYDHKTRVITARNAIGRRRLVAHHVKPRDAEAILDLIGLALLVVSKPDPHPGKQPTNCKCLHCRALRVLNRIGGES